MGGGGLLFKQTLKLTICWGGCSGDMEQGRLWHSRMCHFTAVKVQVVREICYGNSRRPPCFMQEMQGPPVFHQVTTAQPIREASGRVRKSQLSLVSLSQWQIQRGSCITWSDVVPYSFFLCLQIYLFFFFSFEHVSYHLLCCY